MSFKTKFSVATKIVAANGTGDFNDIQGAVDSLPSTGGVVYVKEGTYSISTYLNIIKANVSIIGSGISCRVLSTAAEYAAIVIANNFRIENILLDGDDIGGGLSLLYCADTIIKDVIIRSPVATGILVGAATVSGTFANNVISGAGGNGLYLIDGKNVVFNNKIYGGKYSGIVLANCQHTRLIGNHCYENKQNGIFSNGLGHNTISDNHCIDNDVDNTNTYSGIKLVGTDENTISNNTCQGNDGHDIELDSNSTDNIITGNNCKGGSISIADKVNNEIGHNIV